MKLSVATCQFPTSADIQSNCQYVSQLMQQAREQGADVAHFPEACLSGYAGADLESYDGFDWQLLHDCTYQLLALAGALELWTILGSMHQLSARYCQVVGDDVVTRQQEALSGRDWHRPDA